MNRKTISSLLFSCVTFSLGILTTGNVFAQDDTVQGFVHQQSDASGYMWPEDPAVRQNLDQWQDLKFGVLFHYGLYSIPGILESWAITSEDSDWVKRYNDLPYDEYKKWYWDLSYSLAPRKLDASKWADIIKDAGIKYMIFTSKHHDGFCLFDSKLTDFTLAKGPFKDDPRSNMAKTIFDAFRDKGLSVGCYFSKPDWHSKWFWSDKFATPTHKMNYKKERHPDWWKNYQDFTAGQLNELLGGDYGRFDILWLDGGWVDGEDFGLTSILDKVRKTTQPGLIAVDRTRRGKNENYQTPERAIPERALYYPWESCIPLSDEWGWTPNANYKSADKVIASLIEITAKGGSLLLGVGPTADGEIEEGACKSLAEIGDWLEKNGEAIYGTRPLEVFQSGDVWFTGSKDGTTTYAIYIADPGQTIPATIKWNGNIPAGKVTMVSTGKTLKHVIDKEGNVVVTLPKNTKESFALKFTRL